MKKLFLLLFPLFINAQDVGIGGWKNYLSYNSASFICEANEKVYCVASGGLFFVNKEDNTINRMSKVQGLSDVSIKQIAHSNELNITIIVYENCNIDIIKNNQIFNISDIKRKEIIGIKKINNITIKEGIAYLSTSFGLVLINLSANEIDDTYSVGVADELIINGCAFLGDSIFVATTNGIYISNINYPNLNDYNSWEIYENTQGNYDNIITYNGQIYSDNFSEIISASYNNNRLITTKTDTVFINNDNGFYKKLSHYKFEKIKYAIVDNQESIWVADSTHGLLKFINYEYEDRYIPESIIENQIHSIEYTNDVLIVSHGGKNFETAPGNKNGASILFKNNNWRNYNYYELKNARDIVEGVAIGDKIYLASYYNGIVELDNNEFVERYSWYNTNNGLDTISYWQNDNRMAISDLKIDKNGNMWGLLSSVDNPLFVKTKNNDWYKFSISPTQKFLFDELIIDDYNQKWGIKERGNGIFVYNDNNTIENPNDDQYIHLSTKIGNGNLPSNTVYCFANDLDGQIWVGTDEGIAVFYDPSTVFSGYNFDAQQILISEGEYGQYLLSEEKVKCISVDGANRKWIGTEKSGLFLLSHDGTEEILHFTKENSPLFSNSIIDIAINHTSGEIYIGTEKGMISYRYNAIKGTLTQGPTKVFPNPVREDYYGPIAISGLVRDANIKISDIAGNIVFESTSYGGQAIWNGKNINEERVSTGIYLVFSTDIHGKEKMVSKILFIH